MEAKLKAGYMNKERAAQLAEKDSMKKKEKVHTHVVTYICRVITLYNFVHIIIAFICACTVCDNCFPVTDDGD